MKRFHVHVSVGNLGESVGFYSKLFGAEPTVRKSDYAKWMLEDPRVNFAISTRGRAGGVDHLGFQVDSAEELTALRAQAQRADIAAIEQPAAACCYAKSNKYWITDPQGIAWETFHTLGTVPVYGEDRAVAAPELNAEAACCVPAAPQEGQAASCG
jgi:uncharacterized glyoxalase superfamily protein PhnB